MKHRVAGRKLGRTSAHRLALLRNLSTELFDKERIRTTLGKAKEVRPFAEHLLTLAKRETLHARRLVLRHVHDKEVVAKLFDALSARYAQRPGGYTRIIKLGPRRGDNAEMALIELVGAEAAAKAEPVEDKPAKKAKAAKGSPAEEKPAKSKAKAAPKAKAKPKAEPKARSEAKPKAKAKTKTATTSKAKGGSKSTTPRKAGGS